jgi:1,4-dihydroxy-2-naphthoate octaprenyltransferase
VAEGSFNMSRSVLAVTLVVLFQTSLHLLNEYSDFQTGIDFHTNPTPFSGGSGMLTTGKIAPAAALWMGIASLMGGSLIGVYFLWLTGLKLLPLLLVGAFSVCFYTDVLQRRALGELFSGLSLGLLPVMGAAFIQTGQYSPLAVAVGVPAGLLCFDLLLLCEFPDLEADVKGGRKNLLMVLGKERAGKLYVLLMGLTFLWIISMFVMDLIPVYCLVALFGLAIAWRPMRWAWNSAHTEEGMVSALGANLATNMVTLTLLGVGLLASVCLHGHY